MTYDDYLDGKPAIVTAALTGGVHGKETHPELPETPEEIAAAAAACEAAGASVLHLRALPVVAARVEVEHARARLLAGRRGRRYLRRRLREVRVRLLPVDAARERRGDDDRLPVEVVVVGHRSPSASEPSVAPASAST